MKKENLPNKKMTATGASGAIALILVWIAGAWFGLEVPPEIASAFTVIVSWLAGYLTPEQLSEIVEKITEDSSE